MKLFHYAFVFVVVLAVPVLCAAQVYQWTDENGVKHFSNEPPPEGVQVDQVKSEIQYDQAADQANRARNEAELKNFQDEQRRQQEAEAEAEKAKAAQEAIDAKERELYEAGDTIVRKRRYLGRRGRQWIQEAQRLSDELRELKNDPNADPNQISMKEAQLEDAKQRIVGAGQNYRTRKGLGDDIERYRELDAELKEMKAAQEAQAAEQEEPTAQE